MNGLVALFVVEKMKFVLSFRCNVLGLFVFAATAFSNGWLLFVILRFVGGATIGAVSVCVPMYISEICPNHIRGKFGILHQLNITMGILISEALGLFQSQTIDWTKATVDPKQIDALDKWWWDEESRGGGPVPGGAFSFTVVLLMHEHIFQLHAVVGVILFFCTFMHVEP